MADVEFEPMTLIRCSFLWVLNETLIINSLSIRATLIWSFVTSGTLPVPVMFFKGLLSSNTGGTSCIEEILPADGNPHPVTQDTSQHFLKEGTAVSLAVWLSGFVLRFLGFWFLQPSHWVLLLLLENAGSW